MFKGSMVALITPMDDKGSICRDSLKKLVNYHIYNNTSAIVSVGTTGESSTLSKKEHIHLIFLTLELSQGKIPIIAGTGSNSTTEAISLTKKFENSGVSACLTVTPYYNRPTQEGLYQHFKYISESTNLLQILYNVPLRTGCDLLPDTIGKLSKIKNIIGVKEASGDLSRVQKIKKLVKHNNFFIVSGDDSTALDFIQLGGEGVISVTANIAAKKMSKMCRLALSGNFLEARIINDELMLLHESLFCEPNPIPVKWAAKQLNLIKTSMLRLPMTSITSKTKFIVRKSLKKANLLII